MRPGFCTPPIGARALAHPFGLEITPGADFSRRRVSDKNCGTSWYIGEL